MSHVRAQAALRWKNVQAVARKAAQCRGSAAALDFVRDRDPIVLLDRKGPTIEQSVVQHTERKAVGYIGWACILQPVDVSRFNRYRPSAQADVQPTHRALIAVRVKHCFPEPRFALAPPRYGVLVVALPNFQLLPLGERQLAGRKPRCRQDVIAVGLWEVRVYQPVYNLPSEHRFFSKCVVVTLQQPTVDIACQQAGFVGILAGRGGDHLRAIHLPDAILAQSPKRELGVRRLAVRAESQQQSAEVLIHQ